ncbi:MAG: hypothetical protein QM756_19080 [Polyangiaceae bacterium]
MGNGRFGKFGVFWVGCLVSAGLAGCGATEKAQPGTGEVAAQCNAGLQVVATEAALSATITSVPGQDAVLARVSGTGSDWEYVLYSKLSSLAAGGHPQSRRFTAKSLGLTSLAWAPMEVLGNDLVLATESGVAIAPLDGSAPATLLKSPLSSNLNLAVGEAFIAVSSTDKFAIATRSGGGWQWTAALPFPDGLSGSLLGSLGNELLIANPEQSVVGEATKTFIPGELIRMSLAGDVIARYPTRGNVVSVMHKGSGLLVSETNSFWGSYRAGLEWLDPAADALVKLTDVPVISSTDGNDGAFASVVIDAGAAGEMVYVANGESGLRRGQWSTQTLSLETVAGPWDGSSSFRMIGSVASAGNVLVVPGADQKLYFLKACTVTQ